MLLWDPFLKLFLVKKILTGPINSTQDPPYFSQTQTYRIKNAVQTDT